MTGKYIGSVGKRCIENLFLNDELSDLNVLCEEETFHCHKLVLCSQSTVFKSMLVDNDTLEKSSGEILITDASAATINSLLYFMYHDDFPTTKINMNLLIAADKYHVLGLIEICERHMRGNLTEENAVEVMTKSYLINNNTLFDSAWNFVIYSKAIGNPVNSDSLDEMMKINPILASGILAKGLFLNRN